MKPHKYGAVATVVDNVRFASKKEATRYLALKLQQRLGMITDLALQPRYPLHVTSDEDGTITTIGAYVADFTYRDITAGRAVVEDVKGFKTELYRWKKKHMAAQYGITVQEL